MANKRDARLKVRQVGNLTKITILIRDEFITKNIPNLK